MNLVLLIGLGVEGSAAARYFLSQGDRVFAADKSALASPCPDEFQDETNFSWLTEESAAGQIDQFKLVLRSPGIPPSHPLVRLALSNGYAVTTPTGYWLSHFAPDTTVTVTGSKGKSTTVTLLVELLSAMGLDARPYGNIGAPPLDKRMASAAYPVLELSSYMLHDVPDGHYTHLVTNLFREHTPWHGSESAYHEAKLRPFHFTTPRPGLAPRSIIETHSLPQSVKAIEDLVSIADGVIIRGEMTLPLSKLSSEFREGTNLLALTNAIAAVRLATGKSIPNDAIIAATRNFRALPSRQEFIPSKDGRDWVNDALATIPEAVLHALDKFGDRPISLILGGADREQDFGALAAALSKRPNVSPLIFGSTSERLSVQFDKHSIPNTRCTDFNTAIQTAQKSTPHGGVILFSPAAASEPPHANFAVRAQIFRDAANNA